MRRATDIDREVGKRVKERREALGWNQTALALKIGVTMQQAAKYEIGINRISAGRLYAIAKALDVPVGHFFAGL